MRINNTFCTVLIPFRWANWFNLESWISILFRNYKNVTSTCREIETDAYQSRGLGFTYLDHSFVCRNRWNWSFPTRTIVYSMGFGKDAWTTTQNWTHEYISSLLRARRKNGRKELQWRASSTRVGGRFYRSTDAWFCILLVSPMIQPLNLNLYIFQKLQVSCY